MTIIERYRAASDGTRVSTPLADTSDVSTRHDAVLVDNNEHLQSSKEGKNHVDAITTPGSGVCRAVVPSAFARVFSFSTAVGTILIAAVYFCCLNRNVLSDPDIWWHLRNAQYFADTHKFLRHDIYTSTISGMPWINPEWLAELPYYLAWKTFGFTGIYLLTVAMIEAMALGVCALAWQRKRNIKAAAIAASVFLFMASVSLAPRTQLFGWLCLIAELFLLELYREGKNLLWMLPLIFGLWINLHGSWPIGMLFLAAYTGFGFSGGVWGNIEMQAWTRRQRSQNLLVFVCSVAALLVNPYGWRLVLYPFRIAFTHHLTLSTIVEWQILDFHTFRGKLVFLIVGALLLSSLIRQRRWNPVDLLILFVATLSAFSYARFLLLEAIVMPPLLARELTFFSEYQPEIGRPLLNFAICALLAGLLVTHVPSEDRLRAQAYEDTPRKAVEYLQSHPPQERLWNDFNWGGYLIWNLPRTEVFIDTRADAFEEQGIYADYMDALLIKQPLEILDKYEIRSVLMPKNAPLIYFLEHNSAWTKSYEDGIAVIIQRSGTNRSKSENLGLPATQHD